MHLYHLSERIAGIRTWRMFSQALKIRVGIILVGLVYLGVIIIEKGSHTTKRSVDPPGTPVDVPASHPPLCRVPGLATIEQYRAYLHHTETKCKNMKYFGGDPPAHGDGRKWICLDKRFNIKPKNCLVFSFGVNNEWSFEEDVEKFGCRVYAYDPTMGKESHQHSPKIKFFSTGIANYNGTKKIGMDSKWAMRKVDRFENLVNEAGETGKEIDYVKLDVELSEIDFLQDMLFNSPHLLRKIKQIGMEIHDGNFDGKFGQTTTFQVFWPYYMLLRCHGFKLIQSRNAGAWREVVWAREAQW